MRNLFAAGAMLLACSVPALAADPAPRTLQELDRALGRIIADGHIPGASVAIVENGQVVLAKGYGFANVAGKVAATADTPFRAGSISKGITSIAVMTLVEQHRLDLNATVRALLPGVHFDNPWENTDPVRLVNLLEHTTGWPDISTRVLAKDEKDWSVLQGVQFTMREFVSRWKPGTFTVYNNAGPAVAGLAIEKASGKPFDDYVRDAVLRPMGMGTADFGLTPDLAKRISKSYAPDGTITPYQYIVLRPAGSLNVSARELAQMVRFFLGRGTVDGHQILIPDSVARIERAQSNLGAQFGFNNSYALGNAAFPDSGITFRGHNGSIDSFTSVMGYTLRNKSGYVLMANGGEGVDFATPIAHLVQAYLTRGLPLDAKPTVKLPRAQLERYAGFYRSITPPNDLLRPYGEILGIARVSAGDGKLIVSGNDWFPTGPHSFRRADREDASLAFVEKDGAVYKIGAFNAAQLELAWHIYGLWLTGALIALGSAIGVLMLFLPWVIGKILGRPVAPRTLLMRFVPVVATAAMAAMFALPFMAYADSGASAVHQLADIGPYSLLIMACSIVFPLLALLGLFLSVRRADAPWFVRTYVGLWSLGLSAAAAYTVAIGWFAIRTWTM